MQKTVCCNPCHGLGHYTIQLMNVNHVCQY